METIKIILMEVAAAIVYGILHDQITARVCVEYFTIGHAPIFHLDSAIRITFPCHVALSNLVRTPSSDRACASHEAGP